MGCSEVPTSITAFSTLLRTIASVSTYQSKSHFTLHSAVYARILDFGRCNLSPVKGPVNQAGLRTGEQKKRVPGPLSHLHQRSRFSCPGQSFVIFLLNNFGAHGSLASLVFNSESIATAQWRLTASPPPRSHLVSAADAALPTQTDIPALSIMSDSKPPSYVSTSGIVHEQKCGHRQTRCQVDDALPRELLRTYCSQSHLHHREGEAKATTTFACPFAKEFPGDCSRSCFSGWPSIPRLRCVLLSHLFLKSKRYPFREHISRCHKASRCIRCLEWFASRQKVQSHLRERQGCKRVSSSDSKPPRSMISDDIYKTLKSRTRKREDPVEAWNYIYCTIFEKKDSSGFPSPCKLIITRTNPDCNVL